MPIYEYQCKACGHELEVIQKISEEPLRFCPECGKEELSKLVSAAGFRLKGGGWYETDFKGSKDKKKNLAGDGKSEKKSDSKSESKPAASSEGSKSTTAD
ncbi:FmdB family zinc ribbon protein [Methyloterricola oryzae]|uniref:FmdB family zinc ribbon protein n=1 Tax=Methyloterricola oryzae TaxID=1495050 RepID=UPI0005EB7721|nr:zinc ribbon domain-containing protein [Methyloterricola oryzae]